MKKRFLFGLMAIALAGFGLGGVSMADDVAQIGDNKYSSLRDAITNANAGDIIEMLADDEVSFSAGTLTADTLTLTIDKNLTINGNGKTIKGVNSLADLNGFNDCSSAGTDGKVWHAIEIKADVVISGLNITEFGGNYYTNLCITPVREVSGTLTLNNVKIDKFNRDAITVEGGDFTIKNSEIEGSVQANLGIDNNSCQSSGNPVKCTQYQRAIAVDSNGTINIESTEIKNMTWNGGGGEGDYPVYSIAIDGNTTTATIKDTVITADDDTKNSAGVRVYTAGGSVTLQNVTISLPNYANNNILFTKTAGGTITVESGLYSGSIPAQNGTLTIKGGKFSANPTSYLQAGRKANSIEETPYLYEVSCDAVAQIGTTCYNSLREAVYGAADNDVITLLDDDHVSFDPSHLEFPINKSVTINGNGHTIYGVNDHNSAGDHDIFISAGNSNITIENINISEFASSHYANYRTYPIWTSQGYEGTLTLSGVNIDKFNRTAINIGSGNIIVNGCTIEGDLTEEDSEGYFQGGIENHYGTVTVTNTTITNMGALDRNYTSDDDNWSIAGPIQISGNGRIILGVGNVLSGEYGLISNANAIGGKIIVTDGKISGLFDIEVDGTLDISGGKFSVDPSAYVVAGKYAKQTSDATYPYEVLTKPTPSVGGGGGTVTYSCKNLPDNAVANNSKTPSSNTNYSYSTDTSKVCSFQCKTGYTWDADKKLCDKSGTGTVVDSGALADSGAVAESGANEELEDTEEPTINPELTDIENQDWYDNGDQKEVLANGYTREMNNAYEFAFRAGITTMESIEEANMEGSLTRIAMAKMLSQYAINVLGKKPDTNKKCEFGDVSAELDAQYNNGVTLACQLGIMGVGITNFRPNDDVVRAEFGTALSRLLFGLSDGEEAYYTTHLAKLKAEGIIQNDDPTLEELRGYVMLMLMRSAK